MTNWLSTGTPFDAVIANNDEMAIGAIQAMKAAGIDTSKVIVGGVDATQEALAAMKAGDLEVTVFQDAAGQGKGALDAALEAGQGREGGQGRLDALPAGDAGQHRRLPDEELARSLKPPKAALDRRRLRHLRPGPADSDDTQFEIRRERCIVSAYVETIT